MMKTTLIAGLFLTAAAVPLAAQGMGGPGGPEGEGRRPTFEMLDADGDGKVTQAEIEAFRANRFAEVDADGDGVVTLEEFTAQAVARATERAAEMFGRLDADGDGTLSRDVLEARGPRGPMDEGRMFARLDADGDGAISLEEFEAMKERRAEMRGHREEGGRGDHGRRWMRN